MTSIFSIGENAEREIDNENQHKKDSFRVFFNAKIVYCENKMKGED